MNMDEVRQLHNKYKSAILKSMNKFFNSLIIVMPLLIVLIVEIIYRGNVALTLEWIFEHFGSFILNYVMLFSVLNIFVIFSKRNIYLFFCNFIFLVVILLVYISKVKLKFRGEPLSILDFRLISEALNVVKGFSYKIYIPVVIILFVFILVFYQTLKTFNGRICNKIKCVLFIISLLVLGIFNFSNYGDIANFFAKLNVQIPADIYENHNANGFILAEFIDSKFLQISQLQGYSQDTIEEIYKKIQTQSQRRNGITPNIIFIMSESFWDPTIAKDLSLSQDPIPFFRELSKENTSGTIRVPGFGGGTANTEFEILTGFTKRFLKDYNAPYNPYNHYINRPIDSLAYIMSKEGYKSTAIHTYYSWFYRRDEVYKFLGFDNYIAKENILHEPIYDGNFISDSDINKLIIDQLNESKGKDFIYAVTMGAHGPYDIANLADKEIKVKNNISAKSKSNLENYLYVISQSDKYLKELVNYLKSYPEPTTVVFFGDHLPALGEDVYKEIGLNIYDTVLSRNTPYVIWDNYLTNTEKSNIEKINMDANFLGAYVLNHVGNKTNILMNSLYSLYKLSSKIDFEKSNINYNDYEILQYDIIHGKQYFYSLAGIPKPKDNYTIGFPMKIENVIISDNNNDYIFDVFGRNLSSMSTVYVNSEESETLSSDSTRLITKVPKEQFKGNSSVNIQVKLKNDRNRILGYTNNLYYDDINEAVNRSKDIIGQHWTKLILNGSYDYELFAIKDGFKVIRTNLKLDDIPYYLDKNGKWLEDRNADLMDNKEQSDIYVNGYLYISVSDKESQWNNDISSDDIKEYFNKNQYTLHLASENSFYDKIILNENLDWELFAVYDSYMTVRVNLNLDEKPYVIKKNNTLLSDRNADFFDRSDLSDIYNNKYIYISISNKESGWIEKPSEELIKEYFGKNRYELYFYNQ